MFCRSPWVAFPNFWISILVMTCNASQLLAMTTATSGIHTNNLIAGPSVVILGGFGRIGTAVAIHMLQRHPTCRVDLVGRNSKKTRAAFQEVLQQTGLSSKGEEYRLSTSNVPDIWRNECPELRQVIQKADILIHTAGPYLHRPLIPLQIMTSLRNESPEETKPPRGRVYVDVSDPLPFLEESLSLFPRAEESNVAALVAAGAFPGMSNVLAREAAAVACGNSNSNSADQTTTIQDVRFQYFTAGLGGSGNINLEITNLGFGEPMVQYGQGLLQSFDGLSGSLLGSVDFFLPIDDVKKHSDDKSIENNQAKERVGTQKVFAWPFPEAATVPKHLQTVRASMKGNSFAAMGTAPAIWNDMLGILVRVVPRPWWRNPRFSKFLADFSQPLVWATDQFLKWQGTGETHAMRIDVTTTTTTTTASVPSEVVPQSAGVSILQAHDSFRVCVGQSCAEFALDLWEQTGNDCHRPGVYLPEQYYDSKEDRSRIVEKLTTTPGTFCFTGPVPMSSAPYPPIDLEKCAAKAMASDVVR